MISIKSFFHEDSSTISYLVHEEASRAAMIIDCALDYTAHSGVLRTDFADQLVAFIQQHKLDVEWILETHAHADHISAAHYLKSRLGGKIAAGAGVKDVQKTFSVFFNLDKDKDNASQFDRLFLDGDVFMLGDSQVTIMSTPGHTNDSVTYVIENNAFVGDTLFMPDGGTARCDFPGGNAEALFQSINRIHSLPPETMLWMCHDYQPGGRELKYQCTVAESAATNIHVNIKVKCEEFVRLRESRDRTLDIPRLLYPAIQLNIAAGKLPSKESNGQRFIKQPLNFIQPDTNHTLTEDL